MKLAAVGLALVLSLAACGGEPEPPPQADGNVRFPGPDGELEGTLFEAEGNSRAGIVLAHQNGTDRASWFDFAPELAKEGYTALAFDFSGAALDAEVAAAADYLRKQGSKKILLIGASKGATASLLAAGEDPDVDGVVGLSAVVSFEGLEVTEETMDAIDGPVLLVVGELDDYYGDTKQLREWKPDADLVVFEDFGDHGTELFTSDVGSRVRAEIFDFLERSSG